MITDNNENYRQEDQNFNEDNQSYVDLYQKENDEQENLLNEDESPEITENENLDTEFSNALDLDEFEDDVDENDLEEDPKENEEDENYDQEEVIEPETFSDDGYKID